MKKSGFSYGINYTMSDNIAREGREGVQIMICSSITRGTFFRTLRRKNYSNDLLIMTDSNKNVIIWCSRRYGNFLGTFHFVIIIHYIILYDKHYHAYTPGKFLVNRKRSTK